MNLRVPIAITDELEEELIRSTGSLDLASGEIHDVVYEDYDLKAQGLPAASDDYTFTSGTLSHAGKDVEFSIHVDLFSGRYSVTANELLDIKVRAAKLFAGIEGRALAGAAPVGPTGGAAGSATRSGGTSGRAGPSGPSGPSGSSGPTGLSGPRGRPRKDVH